MTEELPPAPVAPETGLVRTIGALSVAVSVVLLLAGGGLLYALGPWLRESHPLQFDPVIVQAAANDMRRQASADLLRLEQAARSPSEKQRLGAARADLERVNTDLTGQI